MSIKKMMGARLSDDEQDVKKLIIAIEGLRLKLEDLVEVKGALSDPEVLAASQELDVALNEYYRFISNPGIK